MTALMFHAAKETPAHGQAFATREMHAAGFAAHHVFRHRFFLLLCKLLALAAAQAGARNPVDQQGATDQQQIFAHEGIAFRSNRGSLPQSRAVVEFAQDCPLR